MWKPAEVVPEHRRQAVAVWMLLIAGILVYSGFLIFNAVERRANPSTSFILSNDLYAFPDVYVCLYNNLGCDNQTWESECRDSAWEIEGETTEATFNPGGTGEQEVDVGAADLDDYGHCVRFNTSAIEFSGSERRPEDYVLIDMYWYPGRTANSSLTCVAEGETWQPHSESISVFLRDPNTGEMSAGTQVPYNCINSASNSHTFNFMGIGLTEEFPLFGLDKRKYKPTTMITTTHKDAVWENTTAPHAYLSMELAQDVDSYEKIKEIDPLEIAEIFGSVGGFWDLLLLLWPVFFVAAAQNNDPPLKFRTFKVEQQGNRRESWNNRGVLGFTDEREEARPAWDKGVCEPRPPRVSAKSQDERGAVNEIDSSARQGDRFQHVL